MILRTFIRDIGFLFFLHPSTDPLKMKHHWHIWSLHIKPSVFTLDWWTQLPLLQSPNWIWTGHRLFSWRWVSFIVGSDRLGAVLTFDSVWTHFSLSQPRREGYCHQVGGAREVDTSHHTVTGWPLPALAENCALQFGFRTSSLCPLRAGGGGSEKEFSKDLRMAYCYLC